MFYKRTCLLFIMFCTMFFAMEVSHPPKPAEAFSQQVIQQGATGDDVIELQARLQYIGFYNGKIDGVFGWGTYWALRNFQYEFGMKIDGLAGQKTKDKLAQVTDYDKGFVKEQITKGNKFTHYGGMDKKKQSAPKPQKQGDKPQKQPEGNQEGQAQGEQEGQAQGEQPQGEQDGQAQPQEEQIEEEDAEGPSVTAVNVPQGFSQNDIQLMANAVYGEARGEPYEGQVAVAAVILNRLESPTFPNTVAGVIFEPRAFTAVADGQIWLTPNERATEAVLDAINGWDPSTGATYYFNPDTATSSWIWSRPQIKRIGKHIFCN